MLTFFVSIALLITGYFTYGKVIEKVFAPNVKRPTPAYTSGDSVDYVPLSEKKNFFITLINIAGVGPIFGPIMGALYGPVAFIWIVAGCIFAGAVHDYLIGMISVRNNGAHLPQMAGRFLGKRMHLLVNLFTLLLLLLVGTVFVSSPAGLLFSLTGGKVPLMVFIGIIYIYYVFATLLPIDKIVGRIYPFLGALLFFSAAAIFLMLIVKQVPVPNLSLKNAHPEGAPIFPLLFLTISCGALSGFHATQNPMIARTIQNEGHGRRVFYLAMISEGIIALTWAAAAMTLTQSPQALKNVIDSVGPGGIVSQVSTGLLGPYVGMLVIIGVILFPITSGDTAFRSARMIIADAARMPQKPVKNRLIIALPLFIISIILIRSDFNILWRYFSWANQSLAVIALFISATYLFIRGGYGYFTALIPALFMLSATLVYILNAPIGLGLPLSLTYSLSLILTLLITAAFFRNALKQKRNGFIYDAAVAAPDETAAPA
jgi:carbon starvation protein CstA